MTNIIELPRKPTVEELEALLDREDLSIEIQADGSVKAVEGEAKHANVEILPVDVVLRQGADY